MAGWIFPRAAQRTDLGADMLVSYLLDSSSFDAAAFEGDPDYRWHLEGCLRALLDNGVLMVDSRGVLQMSHLAAINKLPIKYRQKVSTLYTELYTGAKVRSVKCQTHARSEDYGADAIRLQCALLTECGLDAVVAGRERAQELRDVGLPEHAVVPAEGYLDSNTESLRRTFIDFPAIDRVTPDRLRDALIRAVRFSKWLRIYDKQIGSADNPSVFLEGLRFLLRLWQDHAHAPEHTQAVEIITAVGRSPRPGASHRAQTKLREENGVTIRAVQANLMEPLCNQFSFPIRLTVKEDPDRIFHRRYLETAVSILDFERGFGLFAAGTERLFRNYVKVSNSATIDISDYRNLPGVEYYPDGSYKLL